MWFVGDSNSAQNFQIYYFPGLCVLEYGITLWSRHKTKLWYTVAMRTLLDVMWYGATSNVYSIVRITTPVVLFKESGDLALTKISWNYDTVCIASDKLLSAPCPFKEIRPSSVEYTLGKIEYISFHHFNTDMAYKVIVIPGGCGDWNAY